MSETLLKETAGDTLVGAIDGVNVDYTVSYDYNADTVNVYVNGRLKIRDWDDGFWTVAPRGIKLKEPLQFGDSLEVEYKADTLTGGGAEGGCPSPPRIVETIPGLQSEQNIPEMNANNLQPETTAGRGIGLDVNPKNLRPVILPNDSGGGCE